MSGGLQRDPKPAALDQRGWERGGGGGEWGGGGARGGWGSLQEWRCGRGGPLMRRNGVGGAVRLGLHARASAGRRMGAWAYSRRPPAAALWRRSPACLLGSCAQGHSAGTPMQWRGASGAQRRKPCPDLSAGEGACAAPTALDARRGRAQAAWNTLREFQSWVSRLFTRLPASLPRKMVVARASCERTREGWSRIGWLVA